MQYLFPIVNYANTQKKSGSVSRPYSIPCAKEIPGRARNDGGMSCQTKLCHAERGCMQPNSASLVQRDSGASPE